MAIRRTTNILIAGVGGQGNRTLMNILARTALAADEEVCTLSSTSLGRLGGPITCHIRIGPAVSAAIPTGEADILVALEMNEALRALPMLRHGALAFIHTYRRLPIIAGINNMHYPSMQEIEKIGTARRITSIFVPQSLSSLTDTNIGQMQATLQGALSANSIMLGTLYGYTRLLPRSLIEQSLCQCLPDHAEQNVHALAIGWDYGERLRG